MPIEAIVKDATGLPDKYVEMAASYIRFLQFQFDNEKAGKQAKRKLGILSDKFLFMSDDFDATPDDFKEYM